MNLLSTVEMFRVLRQSSLLASFALVAMLGAYLFIEPAVTHSQTWSSFTTSQQVTAEISFVASATNVTMDTAIPGITGGTANGSTQVRVYTNNNTGFNMTMKASSSPAMHGNTFGGTIADFSTTTIPQAEPAFAFAPATNRAGFGYSVDASTTTDLDPSFLDDGSICNAGASMAAGACWIGASTTAFTVVNRGTATAASGATSTIFLRTVINSNPVPSITEDTYTATTTLTATVN